MRARCWLLSFVIAVAASAAHADGIQTRGEMFFLVPFQNGGWDQAWVGTVQAGDAVGRIKRARDNKDAPTLTVYVIEASGAGTPAEIEAALPKHVAKDGVEVGGAKITSAVFGKGKEEELSVKVGYGADAPRGKLILRTSTATLNNKPALVAIASFEQETEILVGIPENDAAKALFDKVIHDVSISRRAKRVPKAPELAPLRTIALVKDVTASSAKAKADGWQALAYSLDDPRGLTSAWCEGKPDPGVGESLTITFARPTSLKAIDIASQKAKQVTAVNVSLDGGAPIAVKLDDRWKGLPLDKPVTTVAIAIGATAKGADSCLAVRLRDPQGFDMTVLRGFEPAAVDALPAAITALQAALFDAGRPKLQPLVAFPFSIRATGQKKAVAHKDWAAIAKKCAGDGTATGCPQTAVSSTAFGAFIEPVSRTPGTLDVVFPAESFRATSQDVWRLTWDGKAWKLSAIDWLPRKPGREGS
ncbi:MAG TPA: hypothetical protein VFQ53_01000 [Kofleriaceae bacterium]|nr:hypothetical protein [Kofleriaceae bacterium]